MKNNFLLLLAGSFIKLLFVGLVFLYNQSSSSFWAAPKKPKLIVGIVVDQMRQDYFYRFAEQYSENGFKRLLKQSTFLTEAYYDYTPTYTAPGHASIYTASFPQIHGIIANDWYDASQNKRMYCVQDTAVQGVGTKAEEGKRSPKNLLANTLGDALKLSNQGASKVFAVSIKDRGAILPGGRMADAAYWYVGGAEGKFVSSTYYMSTLPAWVEKFNQSKIAPYLDSTWQTLLPLAQYKQSRKDEYYNEIPFKGQEKAVFPYSLKDLNEKNGNFSMIASTPFGNTLVKDFAKMMIKEEKLGKGKQADFIAISFSSTDKIGHQFGIYSVETQDTYLRLDKDLADLLSFLDKEIGKDNYLVMLTADHGGMDIPSFLAEQRLNAGDVKEKEMRSFLKNAFAQKYGTADLLLDISNFQVFLNKKLLQEKKIAYAEAEKFLVELLENYPQVSYVATRSELKTSGNYLHQKMQNGLHLKRSGDVFYLFEPFWADTFNLGGGVGIAATHGSAYSYDSHVPLLFMGAGIKAQKVARRVGISDAITTLCNLLEIEKPNGAVGSVIEEVLQ